MTAELAFPCRYSELQCARIGIHIPPTKRAGVVADLQLSWQLYLSRKKRDSENTQQRTDAWTTISTKFRELNQELLDWENTERPVLVLGTPERPLISDREFAEHAAQGAQLRELLLRLEKESRLEAGATALAVTDRKGGADPQRERLYGEVLSIWTVATGRMRRAPARTKTGGPQAQFFLAAVEPILGNEAPVLPSLKAIFGRELERRKDGTAYFSKTAAKRAFFEVS